MLKQDEVNAQAAANISDLMDAHLKDNKLPTSGLLGVRLWNPFGTFPEGSAGRKVVDFFQSCFGTKKTAPFDSQNRMRSKLAVDNLVRPVLACV